MRTAIAAVLIMSFVLPAASQPDPGWFMTFTNAEAERCWIEPATGPVTVYVVSRYGEAIGGARFRLAPDPGLNWQYIGETVPIGFEVTGFTGNANDGIVIEGAWGSQPTVLLAVDYLATAVPEPCSRLRIEAYPGSGALTVEVRVGTNVWAVPNFVYDLAAQPCSVAWCVLSTPVENSTWGAIKALYR